MFDFKLTDRQFAQFMNVHQEIRDALRGIAEKLEAHFEATTEGFDQVGEAISDLKTPDPPPDNIAVEGKIMARYLLNEDEVAKNPGPKTYTIVATGFKSRAGTPVGAEDIDLSLDLTGSNMTASLANQRLSGDGKSVEADVTIEGKAQQPTAELAVLKYSGKNRDTGNEVTADTDEFVTGPGEAAIGEMDTPVPLTPIDEAPAPTGVVTGDVVGGGGTTGGGTGAGTGEGGTGGGNI